MTPGEFFDTDSQNPTKLDAVVKDMKKLNDRQLDIVAALVKELQALNSNENKRGRRI